MFTSSNPTVVPEDRYVVGRVLRSGGSGGKSFSVRRTLVKERDPELALAWGGTRGCLARLNLRAVPEIDIRHGQKLITLPARAALETSFRETSEPCVWPMAHAVDQIGFELPCDALVQWAEDQSVGNALRSQFASGSGAVDPVLQSFGMAVRPLLENDGAKAQFFVDHILDGVASYMFDMTYLQRSAAPGRLASWQVKRAKDLIDSRLGGDLSLAELAAACGLSVAHFTRAFRISCGVTPHKWLMSRRVDRAKTLLKTTDMALVRIAAECGFSDQAHLSNVFSKSVGDPPGAFRRRWQSTGMKF